MDHATKALKVRISGRVQGVAFRDWTMREATARGITGWVQNEPDGSVVALITGPGAEVDAMLERFWEGPSHAAVTDVASEAASLRDIPPTFRITG